ncbi:MAG: hypothetical protein MJ016_08485, partial [Victivallaceae bacterium]|nr:hypothetical protein [Victivallaceae bacterium]
KLGKVKPRCGTVVYRDLSSEELRRVAGIAETMRQVDSTLPGKTERPFDFLSRFGKLTKCAMPDDGSLRMIFSYSAVYGDALLPEAADPYPDGLLADYAASGVNAVWLPVILYQLIPWLGKDMELSARCDERMAKLKTIAARAKKHGIRLILYLNEPRAIPDRIKIENGKWRGAFHASSGMSAFCPQADGMLDALSGAIKELCRRVPELGGFFTITMSENITHCLAQSVKAGTGTPCPVCARHSPAENIVEIMKSIRSGMKRAGADDMRLIAYTWAWRPEWAREILEALPSDIIIMSVSETDMETDLDGFKSRTYDYSISKVGPGESAKRWWRNARNCGHRIAAKIQINTCWEMGGVPAIPVPTLVEEHLQKLRAEKVGDFMLGWTIGGYPGGNLELLLHSCREIALRDYGSAAPQILEIWRDFGEAFRKLPSNLHFTIYYSPSNVGPANLLYAVKTDYHSGMVCGIPFDDIDLWRSGADYPRDVYEKRFRILSEEWGTALEKLRDVGKNLPASSRTVFSDLWNRAEATYCALRSTFCQIAFINLRDTGKLSETGKIVAEEIELARRLLAVVKTDSRIGFEAANHYFYGENELREKIIACRALLETIKPPKEKA